VESQKQPVHLPPLWLSWLLFNMCSGIYNLAMYDYSVLKAFTTYYAGHYLVCNKEEGWHSPGGLLLAFASVEAMLADLGAFSKRAIQISWLVLAFPCLLLATLVKLPTFLKMRLDTFTIPFLNTLPPDTFYFCLVLAILAAIVASQAMITGSFQLLAQVMNLSYFRTSKLFTIPRYSMARYIYHSLIGRSCPFPVKYILTTLS
jgi:KUP system potassium uptake protein